MSELIKPKIYNGDRNILATVVHKPEGKGPFPAVILLPGFISGKDEKHIDSLARQLAENGILALRFDPAGFGESEGTITEDYRLSVYMNDIDVMCTWLKHQSFVNGSVIGLFGHSMGGMAAICFGADYPTGISAISVVAPPHFFGGSIAMKKELPDWEKKGEHTFSRVIAGNTQETRFTLPYAFVKDAHPYNALESVKAVKQPIMVITGTMDERVDPKETRELYRAANEPKQYVEIIGMKHSYAENEEQSGKVKEAVVHFFLQNLE